MYKCLIVVFTILVQIDTLSAVQGIDLHPQTAKTNGPVTALQRLYDVQHYRLQVAVQPDKKFIKGAVTITARSLDVIDVIELDLDPRFEILNAHVNGLKVTSKQVGGKLLLSGAKVIDRQEFTATVEYQGFPHVAERAPWDGGFVWTKTPDGLDWVATAVQGNGCDLYWPCKDHISDKADRGADMVITVPKHLTAVMNGVLVDETENADDTKSFHWRTVNPISAYHLALNVGPFQKYELVHHNALSGAAGIPIVFYHVTKEREKIERLILGDFVK